MTGMTDPIALHCSEHVDIPGRGLLHVVAGGSGVDPDTLPGRMVLLDAVNVRVAAVETFAIGRPYPPGLPFGLMVEAAPAPAGPSGKTSN